MNFYFFADSLSFSMFFHIRMTEGLESFVVKERGRPTGAATEPVKKWEPFVNGEEGCVRETRKGVLHDDDHHFSELFEALKNASAWRKDFFAMLRGRPTWAAPLVQFCI
jgi:hypothetical protein